MKDDGLLITDTHVFFYRNKCPFSNFYYPCSFTYTVWPEGTPKELVSAVDCHRFFTSEQAFMYHKARYFHDNEIADRILFEGNEDPKFCKEQGRLVRNYDDEKWSKVRYSVFRDVNFQKFFQDSFLRRYILDGRFDGKTFVEASPYDSIWGIHMRIDDAGIDNEQNWKGQNLLGKAITEVRNLLKTNMVDADTISWSAVK